MTGCHIDAVYVRFRRFCVLGLIVLGIAVPLVTFLAYVDDHHYVYLHAIAHPFAGIAVGALLFALAARWGLQSRGAIVAVQWLAIAIVATALIFGARVAKQKQPLTEVRGPVVAASEAYQLVEYRTPTLYKVDSIVLRLRSRAGLASREGTINVACFAVPGPGVASGSILDTATFLGPDRLELRTKDGMRWIVAFNGKTLVPAHRLDRCTGRAAS